MVKNVHKEIFVLFEITTVGHVLVVRVDIGLVIYEAVTPQCGRSLVQVLLSDWI